MASVQVLFSPGFLQGAEELLTGAFFFSVVSSPENPASQRNQGEAHPDRTPFLKEFLYENEFKIKNKSNPENFKLRI
jgi:hypothetical protein